MLWVHCPRRRELSGAGSAVRRAGRQARGTRRLARGTGPSVDSIYEGTGRRTQTGTSGDAPQYGDGPCPEAGAAAPPWPRARAFAGPSDAARDHGLHRTRGRPGRPANSTRLRALIDVAARLSGAPGRGVILRTVVDETARLLVADVTTLRVLRDGRLELAAWSGLADDVAAAMPVLEVEGWYGELLHAGEPSVLSRHHHAQFRKLVRRPIRRVASGSRRRPRAAPTRRSPHRRARRRHLGSTRVDA